MKRKIFTAYSFLVVSCLLLAVSLVSCAPPKKADGTVTVEIWVMPNSLEPVGDLERLLKPFAEKNPRLKVKITSVDWGAAWSKITTAATSGDVPDIAQIGSTWLSAISAMGALEDLQEKVPELGGEDTFVPVAWQTTGIEGSGQVTGIPWLVDARGLYYRTDVFKTLDLTVQNLENWDAFKDTLQKIYSADLVLEGQPLAPLGISGKNDWNVIHSLAPWIWMAGGDFLSADRKNCTLDAPEVFAGISFYINLVRENLVPPEYLELNTAQVSATFNSGAVALYFDGPYEIKTLTRPPEEGGAGGGIVSQNFAVAGYPQGPKGRFTFVGGSHLSIFKKAKHKKEALEVIKYLTSKEAQIQYAKVSGFLPARKDAFADSYFSQDNHRKIFKDAVYYGRTYPAIPAWGLLEPILTRRLGILWDYVTSGDKYDPEKIKEQLKLAKKEVETILEQ